MAQNPIQGPKTQDQSPAQQPVQPRPTAIPAKLSYSSGVVSVAKEVVVQNSNRILSDALKGNLQRKR